MIKRFRSKALKSAFEGNLSKIHPNVQNRVAEVLDVLDAATSLEDLNGLTGFHALKGDREGEYAVTITANWRITFTPLIETQTDEVTGEEDEVFHVSRVDFEDYH